MINIGFQKNSKWVIRSACICRKSTSHYPIGIFFHFSMGLKPSPRLWVTILLNWVFPPSLAYTQYSMWTSFAHTFRQCWTHQRYQRNWHLQCSTLITWNRKPLITLRTHSSREPANRRSKSIGWSKQANYSTKENGLPRVKFNRHFPSDGGTQCNGYHFLLNGED